jgi:hypothetical protein
MAWATLVLRGDLTLFSQVTWFCDLRAIASQSSGCLLCCQNAIKSTFTLDLES